MNKKKGKLIIVSGFSGAGKGTVIKEMMKKHEGYALSVSMTTREPRPGEIPGVTYHYVSDELFQDMIEKQGFMEYAGYVGNYYGTPKAFVEEHMAAGDDVLLEIEMQGARQIKAKFPESVMIFMVPPTADELKRRLEDRKSETALQIKKRLKRAAEEAKDMGEYEYILINDTVETCAGDLNQVIQTGMAPIIDREALIKSMNEGLAKILEGDN